MARKENPSLINPTNDRPSFLQLLVNKQSMVFEAQSETGKNMLSAIKEVDRQISQALKGGDPIRGTGVTKSGGND